MTDAPGRASVTASPTGSLANPDEFSTRTLAVQYEARTSPFRRYTFFYSLGALTVALVWGCVLSILLPLQVQQIEFAQIFTGADSSVNLQALSNLKAQVDAGDVQATAEQARQLGLLAEFNSSRAANLSLVTSISVFLTMLIQPIVGTLSDRTRSRWGRRAPWIAAGGVGGAALICLLPVASNIALLVLLWSAVQLVVNLGSGPMGVTVADRVPEDRIGGISALSGLMGYLGAIGGSILAGMLFASIGLATYYPIALVLALGTMAFVIFARDKSSIPLPRKALGLSALFGSFVAGLRDHDYRWAWISKVALYSGYGLATVYSVYMLQSYVTPALSAEQAAQTAPLLQFAALPGTLVAMLVVGRWSDRIQRRKPFVIASAALMGLALLIPAVWPSLTAMFVQAIVTGVGFGAFIVVDQALFIEVLPDREAAGRDLGLSTLGQNFGQALGPIVAGGVVAVFGGLYGPVWVVGAVIVLASIFAIVPIKRVR